MTGREQATLATFAGPSLDELTEAERDAYQAIRQGDSGVREYARRTDRAPGTVGNLLARADAKLGGS
ncbi:sigma-70 region 4 domain-containing protein [Salarchaeum japonicum]|uniref:Uncharacterized protein n=1 Tax=Salarchaeum japonicum TaxID=555573 RepID=A0AAV3T0J5_9EURY|nr:sigma-70 region 4 domain-containing protein [Salarchaeum japonicum]